MYRGGMGESLRSPSSEGPRSSSSSSCGGGGGSVRVFVRKRPIHDAELDALEFDVVTVVASRKLAVVHDGRMEKDMRHLLMNHHSFEFDGAFGDAVTNDAVYEGVASPLVRDAAGGGYATILMYGQTGSGKTFTMTAIYERAARELFASLPPGRTVAVSFFELAGDACSDLLNGFESARLMTGADGSVHAFPLVEVAVGDADALLAMVTHGVSVRATAATGVHDASSRSHAVLRVYVYATDEAGRGGSGDTSGEGVLTLVDLAGSEHRIDSDHHTRQRRKEGAEINASLMALKSVVHARARSGDSEHLYRKSKLTMALKNSFVLDKARTAVIATVSPSSKDTEHSLNTLRHACVMGGQQVQSDEAASGGSSHLGTAGNRVETESLGEIDVAALARAARRGEGRGGVGEDGTSVVEASNGNEFRAADDPWEKLNGRKLAAALAKQKRANEKRARQAMAPAHRALLVAARDPALVRAPGGRQEQRLRRVPGGFASRREAELYRLWAERGYQVLSFDDASGRVKVWKFGDDGNSEGGGGDGGCLTVGIGDDPDEALAAALAASRGRAAFDAAYGDEREAEAGQGRGGKQQQPQPQKQRAPRAVFRKLKAIAYSDETAPEVFKAKQLGRMLRKKGYAAVTPEGEPVVPPGEEGSPNRSAGGTQGGSPAQQRPPWLGEFEQREDGRAGVGALVPPLRQAPTFSDVERQQREQYQDQLGQQQRQQGPLLVAPPPPSAELRVDPADGNPYTYAEFVEEYGDGPDCDRRWEAAARWVAQDARYGGDGSGVQQQQQQPSSSPVSLQRIAHGDDWSPHGQQQQQQQQQLSPPQRSAPVPVVSVDLFMDGQQDSPQRQAPLPAMFSAATPQMSRMERVKAAREKKIADEQRALLEKRAKKEQRRQQQAPSSGGFNAEIAALEEAIAAAPSAASKYGLEKQLKAKRAAIVRQQRKVEMEQREVANAAAESARQAEIRRRQEELQAAANEEEQGRERLRQELWEEQQRQEQLARAHQEVQWEEGYF